MVHRPADSRLLANLLSHEKDYSKQLSTLIDYSQASLASFSAFAAACAPPTSQVIIAVAGALAGADDALRNYAAAVERWQDQLRALKTMEDDVGNIMRDREILVTRLIKASKQQKPNRDSVLSASPSGSTLSVTKSEVHVGQKLSAAQAELQACEAQLAAKEQELNVFRIHTIKSGLQARCQAMVECGWAWGEMGKEGIRVLDTLDMTNGHGSPLAYPYIHKPLPGQEVAGSDISSLAPSQSASQIGHSSGPSTLVDSTWRGPSPLTVPTAPKPYTLHIPPAHSIGEFVLPNGTIHATIEEETGGGSSAEEDEPAVPVEVVENPRFTKGKPKAKAKPAPPPAPPSRHISFSLRGPKASTSENLLGDPTSLRDDSPAKKTKTRAGVFGSLAALFHVGGSRHDGEDPLRSSLTKTQGRWHTRIDRNLASVRRGDSSDDDAPALSQSYGPRTASPLPISDLARQNGVADPHRLKKRASKRGSVQAPPPSRTVNTDKGYSSDTVAESVSKARAKSGRQNGHSKTVSEDGVNTQPSTPRKGASAGQSGSARLKKSSQVAAALMSEGGSSLSRDSSLSRRSIASAPARTTAHAATPSPLARQASTSRKRTASLNVSPSTNDGSPSTPSKHKRTLSTSGTPSPPRNALTNGEPSLMSIVEDISRINKQSALAQDPSRLLVVPKAPGPVNVSISDDDFNIVRLAGKQHSEGSSSPPPPRPRLKKEERSEVNNYRNSLHMSASVSAPSLPIETASQPKPLPAKVPLRSALRNGSRSPSPTKVPVLPQPIIVPNGKPITTTPIPQSVTATTITPATMEARRKSDASSISSYETGHEEFDEEVSPADSTLAPPPPHDDQHIHHTALGSDISHSTASTASTAGPPARRKSVRMSLPPTFSATPPAIDDTDEDEDADGTPGKRRHEPWSSRGGPPTPRAEASAAGWGSRIEQNGAHDVWAGDSSDETDDEYSAAKRLLSRLARKHEHH
ncbi:hypothetical protein BN946_scf185033.g29 [Trametes cinnabarina]|uniref:Uncharacterized protein n=1 Tax=Pycnoporus cinnabarinus TaxID=5643 RepID=A0A060SQP1_PYCCI|nr:hypothetical protein BN946_scf185033.g29 [Trametes cinnabarina]